MSIGENSDFPPNTGSLMALTMLLCVFSLALLSHGRHEAPEKPYPSGPIDACNRIAAAISGASQVYFPREPVILSSFVILKVDD